MRRARGKSTSRAPSRKRYETVAQAPKLSLRSSRSSFSPRRTVKRQREQRYQPRNRRSKARLKQYEQTAPRFNFKAAVWSPVKNAVHVEARLLVNVLFLGLLGWVLVWFFVSDRFYIDQIVVKGNQRVSTEAIVRASSIQGYSIFWVNARQVASDIVGQLPPVRHVRIRCGLPNTITLLVEEQGGQVMWQVAGKQYWVDDDGHLHLAQVDERPKLLVKDIRPGAPTRVDVDAVVAAQQVTQLLPELSVIEYGPITGLRFTHSRGWMVYLGTGEDMAHKVSVLRAMEVQFAGEDVVQPSLVDLRFPDSPYYRFPTEPVGGM